MALTDTAIRNAKPKAGKTTKLSDGEGLQLWVLPSGAKSWNLAYRFAGKQRKLNIGTYPAIDLKEARRRRDKAKGRLDEGIDPSQQKQIDKLTAQAENNNTFAALVEELLIKKRREAKAETTVGKLEWILAKATPLLGPRPIASITAPEVLAVLRPIEARGRLETAGRLRAVIGQVFDWR